MLNFFNAVIKYILSLLSVILFIFIGLPDTIEQNLSEREKNIAQQIQRIESLSDAYASGDYVKVNESKLAGFDVEKAYADGVKFNEVAYVATHNSYQLRSVEAYRKIYSDLDTVTFGLVSGDAPLYSCDSLTEQFNVGIRSIELDIETVADGDDVSFVCSHSPLIDMNSTCYDFELALKEIKMWSDANPGHLPITVIVEPKKVFIPDDGRKLFKMEYADRLDTLVRDTFGEKLLTPADMMGDYGSLKEMREADGWLPLKDCAGKVLVLLHDTTVTGKYIKQDETIKTQAMFPMLRYADRDESYASFLIVNDTAKALKYRDELVFEKKLIVRTMLDTYGSHSDEDRSCAFESCAQILSTDYPPRADMTGIDYYVDFAPGTVKIIK